MSKVSAPWMSRNLSEHDLHQWVALSGNLLAQVTNNCFSCLFIGDKM